MRTWKRLAVVWFGLASAGASPPAPEDGLYPYCPIVDGARDPLAAGSVGWTPNAAIRHASEKFGFVEMAGHVSFGYFRTQAGDFDLSFHGRLWFATDGRRYDVPDTFGQGAVRVRWDHRTPQGLTFRGEMLPGYYAELGHLEWDDLALPVKLSGIQTIHRSFAVQAGFGIYPGFENAFDPILGVRFAPHPDFTVDLAYPESRAVWRVHPDVGIVGEYQIHRVWQFSREHGADGGDFVLRDHRLAAGADVRLTPFVRATGRAGMLLQREIGSERGIFREAGVSDSLFLSFGIAGDF